MKKIFKALLCGIFALGFTALMGAYSLKAEDKTFVEDLDGDGKEDIVTYDYSITEIDDENSEYTMEFTVNGKKAYSEGRKIELYPEVTDEHKNHDVLWTLGSIYFQVIDIDPSDSVKEIIASYYSYEDGVLLGIKVFRMKGGKLVAVCEDYDNIGASAYIPVAQKKNKYLTVANSVWTETFGCVWVYVDYKLTKNGLVLKPSKSGVYNVAPNFYEEGNAYKFKAARNIKVYSDKAAKNFKDEIKKKAKFTLKKVKMNVENPFEDYTVYVKASGIKGWIEVDTDTDEYGTVLDKLVTNPVWFS
jgi:hypothetical protein